MILIEQLRHTIVKPRSQHEYFSAN